MKSYGKSVTSWDEIQRFKKSVHHFQELVTPRVRAQPSSFGPYFLDSFSTPVISWIESTGGRWAGRGGTLISFL